MSRLKPLKKENKNKFKYYASRREAAEQAPQGPAASIISLSRRIAGSDLGAAESEAPSRRLRLHLAFLYLSPGAAGGLLPPAYAPFLARRAPKAGYKASKKRPIKFKASARAKRGTAASRLRQPLPSTWQSFGLPGRAGLGLYFCKPRVSAGQAEGLILLSFWPGLHGPAKKGFACCKTCRGPSQRRRSTPSQGPGSEVCFFNQKIKNIFKFKKIKIYLFNLGGPEPAPALHAGAGPGPKGLACCKSWPGQAQALVWVNQGRAGPFPKNRNLAA